jgi:hypothetical protein
VQGLHLIVTDIQAAREDLVARGVDASEVFHCESGYACRFPGQDAPVPGPHPDRGTYGLLPDLRRPGRQRLAAAGGHAALPGTRLGRHDVRVGERPDGGARAGGERARRARGADRPAGRPTGRSGTRSTW